MATEAEQVEQARANLLVSVVNATARLAELDAVPITERARMSYTEGQQTYGWNEYRAALMQQIQGTTAALDTIRSLGGPFTVAQVL